MSNFAIFSQLKRKECAMILLQNKITNFLSIKGSVQASSHFLVVPNAIYVVGEYFLPKLEICSQFFPARKLTIHTCQEPNASQNRNLTFVTVLISAVIQKKAALFQVNVTCTKGYVMTWRVCVRSQGLFIQNKTEVGVGG